jgi:hypothetical protein
MVGTHSSHPVIPPTGAPGTSNNQEMKEFMRQMAESMEIMRKQNEDLNTRLTVAEVRSSRRERERKERCEKERRDRVRRGKRAANPDQWDNESKAQGSLPTVQNEEHRKKSRRVESPNGGSHRERSHCKKSPHEGSCHKRHHREKSHRERRHPEKPQHDESHNNHRDEEVEDLKRKYALIAQQIAGEDLKVTTMEMLDDENHPFSKRVRAYAMPDKFKMPRVEKYNGSGDPKVHLEAFQEHLILYGTPYEIACRAFPLTLTGVAKDWFTKLPPKSVDSFKELGYQFLAQFFATRKRKYDSYLSV